MYVFWNAIKTIRAGAYFKNALNNNNANKAKQAKSNSHSISEKVLLSGIIFAATAALLCRSIYRKIKSKRNKKKTGRKIIEPTQGPVLSDNNSSHPQLKKPIKSDEPKEPSDNGLKNNNSLFLGDEPLSYHQTKILENLKTFKVWKSDKNKIVYGTVCLTNLDNKVCFYVNQSGVFNSKHNQLLKPNATYAELSFFAEKYDDTHLADLVKIKKVLAKEI